MVCAEYKHVYNLGTCKLKTIPAGVFTFEHGVDTILLDTEDMIVIHRNFPGMDTTAYYILTDEPEINIQNVMSTIALNQF
jgi:hypothetical protein